MMAGRSSTPPPAQGVRLEWAALPEHVRAEVERQLGGAVVGAATQPMGFSPGVAARLRLADGRGVFVKAIGPEPNPDTPAIHRREARIVAALPPSAPVPRLLWSHDEGEGGWVVLAFEEAHGQHPAQPWQADELERVLAAMATLSEALTPSPLPPEAVPNASDVFRDHVCGWGWLRENQPAQLAQFDAWPARHLDALVALEAQAPAAVAGDTLLHFDLRADNVLLSPEQVWFVDWPHACIGAPWVDVALFAPSVTMQGGPAPEAVLSRHPGYRRTHPDNITAAIVAFAGFLTQRAMQPPPPGLPTVRAFQAAQAIVAYRWIAERTGLV